MLDDIHKQFIAAVRDGRGARLKETPETFSGLVWNGQRAIDIGLADAFGSVDSVARDVFGAEQLVDFTPREDIAHRLARRFGAETARFALAAIRSGALAIPQLR
jgi:protease-4